MSRDRKGSECSQIAPVLEGDEGKRDDDQENGLLMDVPPKQERRIPAQRHGPDERVPCRVAEQFQERQYLKEQRQGKTGSRCDLRKYGKCSIPHQTTSDAVHRIEIDRQLEPWGHCMLSLARYSLDHTSPERPAYRGSIPGR